MRVPRLTLLIARMFLTTLATGGMGSFPTEKERTFPSKGGHWVAVLFLLQGMTVASVLVSILRHALPLLFFS